MTSNRWFFPDNDYHQAIDRQSSLRLVLVGKNPYPNGATGIPFIKSEWPDMKLRSCSGRHVLESLTGMSIDDLHSKYFLPRDLAMRLLTEAGIVLLNASYFQGPWRAQYIKMSWDDSNREIIVSAAGRGAQVLLCGQAGVIEPWVKKEGLWPGHAPHPSLQSRASLSRFRYEEQWHSCWDRGALKEAFRLPDLS